MQSESCMPTWIGLVEPGYGAFHRLREILEEWNAEDAARAEHQRFEGDVVDEERSFDDYLASVERLHETYPKYSKVASRVAA